MHFAGPPRDFDPIRQLVAGRNIAVIEDAAHAFGSTRDGQLVGAGSEFTAFSFAPTKQIASSNGGVLLFRDAERRAEINQLAFLGLTADTYKRTTVKGVSPPQHVARIGHKYKIDDLAAAVAYAAVEHLEDIVEHRAALVRAYCEQLEGLAEVELLPHDTNAQISWYIMPIRVPAEKRDGLRAHLAAHNIDSTVHYPNLLEQPAFKDARGTASVAARESRRVVSLPLHHSIDLGEVDRICDAVSSYLR
jgi:perosamine synthetase